MYGQDDAVKAARILWGQENPRLSSAKELRWGTKGSKSLALRGDLTVWFDHEAQVGGGIIDICREAKLDNGGGNPETPYPYDDEQENLLFQVVRFPGHKFLQRRPDGKGDWIYNLDGVRRVPYHLSILVRSTQDVFITEGEKDADNLAVLGLITTTNPGGAGKWRQAGRDSEDNRTPPSRVFEPSPAAVDGC